MPTPSKVIVLGGGVAGLSAAHELAERGFRVEVYEAQRIPGGKARSIGVPGTGLDGRKDLPGEHGFRFFPGFYRHVIDTMTRIPYRDGRMVSDNLEETTRMALGRYDQQPLIADTRFPRHRADLQTMLQDLTDRSVHIDRADKEFFIDRLWQILTSCEARRLDEYEKLGWWDFIGAEGRSEEYQKYLCFGLTRTLVAAQPRLASTKTGGNILLQLLIDMLEPTEGSDRVLNGPTNEVWIQPWIDHLVSQGVTYHRGALVTAIHCDNGVVSGVTIAQEGTFLEVTGDYYLAALPVERMAPLVSDAMIDADPRLESIRLIQKHVHMMNGIQFYLSRDFPLVHGHAIYIDSAWALTSISQKQFWPNVDLSDYGDGTTSGVISVDISEWNQPGKITGKMALECTPREIANEVWEELKHCWTGLADEHLQRWFLDPDISMRPMKDRDKEFLLVNEVNTWGLRPDAFTRIPNLFLASDYVRTNTDLATMEGANEAARRAVNSILSASHSSAPYCRIWKIHEPDVLTPWREEDRERYQLGLPWNGKPEWDELWQRQRLPRPLQIATERLDAMLAGRSHGITGATRLVEGAISKVIDRLRGTDGPAAVQNRHIADAESPGESGTATPMSESDSDSGIVSREGGLRIAVLGGGMGALAAVIALTDPANPARDRIEKVTVYQQGWRLGGKGASGRGEFGRIEEHGLHIWLGFYENAFRMIQQVYQEADQPPDSPLARWDEGFKKHSLWVVEEPSEGGWKHWPLTFPTDGATPGTGGELPSMHQYLELALGLMRELFQQSPHREAEATLDNAAAKRLMEQLNPGSEHVSRRHGDEFLRLVHETSRILPKLPVDFREQRYHDIAATIDSFSEWLHARPSSPQSEDDHTRRLHILIELLASGARGIIRDVLIPGHHDLGILDSEDFRHWLKRHGAPEAAYNSAIVRGLLYDLAFAYRNGDTSQPSFAAGTALRCALRVIFTYKGAVFWKMQAGMGDTIFAPIYEVLRKRGVDFEFFHAVRNVGLASDGASVTQIEIGRQTTVRDGEYRPLKDVKGLPCWPSQPDYSQLVEGEELRGRNVNLESFWADWDDRERIMLHAGSDFDVVILGVSLASLPYICPELIDVSARWRDMVAHVETTRTQAFQLWLRPSVEEMGWTLGSPVLDAFVQPLNTWADMSQLIDREDWPDDRPVGNIAYFCGPMKGDVPDAGDKDAPERETELVKAAASEMMTRNVAPLWPRAVDREQGQGLDPGLLLDPQDRRGAERLDGQYFRANIDPSERYVLSVVDSSQFRLHPGASGFANLVLAGDWTWNGINVGCIEAAVMSGLLAAQAICGYPENGDIVGIDHP